MNSSTKTFAMVSASWFLSLYPTSKVIRNDNNIIATLLFQEVRHLRTDQVFL